MTPTRLRRWRESSRIASAFRGLTICLLTLATTGIVPVAAPWLEELHGCGGPHRMRCLCQHCPTTAVRGPCPCCDDRPGAWSRAGELEPAVLPRPAISLVVPTAGGPFAGPAQRRILPPRDVPHPPPRTHVQN